MTTHTPINPLLQAVLPDMIVRLADAKRVIEDTLRPITVDMRAVADFLDFEIERAELQLSKAEWSSQADTDAIEARIQHLKALRSGVEKGDARSIMHQLEQVLAILKRLRDEAD